MGGITKERFAIEGGVCLPPGVRRAHFRLAAH